MPVPKLVVFYNGLTDQPEARMMNLFDAFAEAVRHEADISVRVRMININKSHSAGVVNNCKPLNEYTWLVDRIRAYGSRMPLEAAVDRTLREMPEDYLIKPWLEANREGDGLSVRQTVPLPFVHELQHDLPQTIIAFL